MELGGRLLIDHFGPVSAGPCSGPPTPAAKCEAITDCVVIKSTDDPTLAQELSGF